MALPLVCTVRLDGVAQTYYETLRERYFPAERNFIPAHLTLFHHLPDDERIHQALKDAAGTSTVFVLGSPTLRSIGRGVAVFFRSEVLIALHRSLATAFEADLIAQDRQRFQPHIVVQNKVRPEIARRTLSELDTALLVAPQATGLTLWRYLGGPWEHLHDFGFAAHVR